ncbi:MAG TPA: hypothetical protein P5307_12370, partial [Pirellulaceae bacterium]|nr:hypothetical protein [Pirellulaceae bacterium]
MARNFIGWDPGGSLPDLKPDAKVHSSKDKVKELRKGLHVKVEGGTRDGDTYEYIGKDVDLYRYEDSGTQSLVNGDRVKAGGKIYRSLRDTRANLAEEDYANKDNWVFVGSSELGGQEFGDLDSWKLILPDNPADAASVQAFAKNAQITVTRDLILTANAEQEIRAVVVAGSVAIAVAAGGETGVGVSGAGVYNENRIRAHAKAFIDGDGAGGIQAGSVTLKAHDGSGIAAVAGAASVAGAVGGTAGVSVALGLSLAFNEISSEVDAYIANADQGLTTTAGGASDAIYVSATASGGDVLNLQLSEVGISTFDQLDDLAKADQDDPDTHDKNEAHIDVLADAALATNLYDAFKTAGVDLPDVNTVSNSFKFTSTDIKPKSEGKPTNEQKLELHWGDTVKVAPNHQPGGKSGHVYRFIGTDKTSLYLPGVNFTVGDWLEVIPLRVSVVSDEGTGIFDQEHKEIRRGTSWVVTTGDGKTYTFKRDPDHHDDIAKIQVSLNNITVVSAAASVGVAIGGEAGVSVAGAGAVSQNVILSKTNAYVDNSVLKSAGDVHIESKGQSEIAALVASESISAGGGGGTAGVGVGIGISVARNFIGWQPDGTENPAEIRSRITNSSIDAVAGKLTLTADASQAINALVVAGSGAVGVGGVAGVAVAGSGVFAENRIGVDVDAAISGDGAKGIQAGQITLTANDHSTIASLAEAVALAFSFGTYAGVSVAVGASLATNVITSSVESFIEDADAIVKTPTGESMRGITTTGPIVVSARETASIFAGSAAASIAAGFGVAGVAVSGAGAEATNTILTHTKAYVDRSHIDSAGNVDVDATNDATIIAVIFSAAFSVGGGAVGVGASLGAALARNLIGYEHTDYLTDPLKPAIVRAYVKDTTVTAAGLLTVD